MGLLEPMHIIIILLAIIGLPFGGLCLAVSGSKIMSRTEAFFLGFLLNIIGLIVVLCSPDKNEMANLQFESIPDQLKKYKDLLDGGAITESKYNTQKAKLLNQ